MFFHQTTEDWASASFQWTFLSHPRLSCEAYLRMRQFSGHFQNGAQLYSSKSDLRRQNGPLNLKVSHRFITLEMQNAK